MNILVFTRDGKSIKIFDLALKIWGINTFQAQKYV